MKILILTFGSTGDVVPFLALGKGLQEKGHIVGMATADRFEPLIRSHGLAYFYVTGELLRLIDTKEGRQAIEDTVGIGGTVKTMVRLVRKTKPITLEMMKDSWKAAQAFAPDLIVYHPKALAGVPIAEKLNIPVVMAALQPMMVPTSEFPLLIFNRLPFGKRLNRISYDLVKLGNWAYGGLMNRFRRDTLNLKPFPNSSVTLHTADQKPIRVLHGFSSRIIQRPSDWPETASVNGYWFLNQEEQFTPTDQLSSFLETSKPLVYFGFGSMAGKNPDRLGRLIVEAVEKTGIKAIFATGWGGLKAEQLPDSILTLKEVPHDWLFPKVSALVHHGGAGTTAAGLKAGKPSLVCPFIADQPFWGRRVYQLGLGVKPILQKKLTLGKLVKSIETLVSDSDLADRADRMGQILQAENGVGKTVREIEEILEQNQ